MLALPIVWQLKHRITSKGEEGFSRKVKATACQSQPLGTASLPHAPSGMETEQRVTIVHILALAI